MTIFVTKTANTVDVGIDNMIAAANADYDNFIPASRNAEMNEEFHNGWRIKEGSKYIWIGTRNSAWGFVVNTDNDKKFKKGDILIPAGYKAPARNGARGNVLDGGYPINWTGPLYLK
jgi:hypothetical protein